MNWTNSCRASYFAKRRMRYQLNMIPTSSETSAGKLANGTPCEASRTKRVRRMDERRTPAVRHCLEPVVRSTRNDFEDRRSLSTQVHACPCSPCIRLLRPQVDSDNQARLHPDVVRLLSDDAARPPTLPHYGFVPPTGSRVTGCWRPRRFG